MREEKKDKNQEGGGNKKIAIISVLITLAAVLVFLARI